MCNLTDGLPGGTGGGSAGGVRFNDPLDLTHGQARRDAASAAAKAEAAEAARQARISGNVRDINTAYDSREPQYAQFTESLRSRLNEGIQLQRQAAERSSKFALARSGNIGGSLQRDQSAELNREGREATLAGERQVQAGVGNLRATDEDSRSRLIALAQSGNDIGNPAAQAASILKANLGTAQNTSNVANLGDLFGNTGAVVKNQNDAAARRRGLTEASTYSKPFSRGP